MTNPQRSFRNPGIPFDPLQYVKRLEAVGFTREQAETQAETFLSIVQEQLVTKQDLKESETQLTTHMKEIEAQLTTHIKEIEAQLTTHIKEIEAQLTNRIKEIEAQLTNRMKELEIKTTLKIEVLKRDLKIWFGGMLVGLVVVMSGIMTLIVHLGGH
jgi:DNA anti-recombination protein RmuC